MSAFIRCWLAAYLITLRLPSPIFLYFRRRRLFSLIFAMLFRLLRFSLAASFFDYCRFRLFRLFDCFTAIADADIFHYADIAGFIFFDISLPRHCRHYFR